MALGKRQALVLAALRERGAWHPDEEGPRLVTWAAPAMTIDLVESLVRRGLVANENGRFFPREVPHAPS